MSASLQSEPNPAAPKPPRKMSAASLKKMRATRAANKAAAQSTPRNVTPIPGPTPARAAQIAAGQGAIRPPGAFNGRPQGKVARLNEWIGATAALYEEGATPQQIEAIQKIAGLMPMALGHQPQAAR